MWCYRLDPIDPRITLLPCADKERSSEDADSRLSANRASTPAGMPLSAMPYPSVWVSDAQFAAALLFA